MNLSELRDLIRSEADIQGLSEYTNLIDQLINMELQRQTGKAKYNELLVEELFTATADEEFTFDLPADYQLLNKLTFAPAETSRWYANPYDLDKGHPTGYRSTTEGSPQFFSRVGSTIKVYPYTGIYINDTLILSYYKKPELLLDDDLFPVESLINVVQQYVMARMLRLRNTKASVLVAKDADRAFFDSRAEAAGS